jgi:alkylhydroperoxidase/carboxymuconolactone decarboxylase family protein YurZ
MTHAHGVPTSLATRADDLLRGLPNAKLLTGMASDSFKASGLDRDTIVLVWLAALVALDAPSQSYVVNLGGASQTGVSEERVHQVLTALAPIVGTPRIISAASKIAEALRPGP